MCGGGGEGRFGGLGCGVWVRAARVRVYVYMCAPVYMLSYVRGHVHVMHMCTFA